MLTVNFIKLKEPWRKDPFADPPLGFLYVIACALENPKVQVIFTDMAWQTEIKEADVFALSASTLDYPELIRLATELKQKYPKSFVIAGGPHFDAMPSSYWDEVHSQLPIDIICRGEGENTFKIAIDSLVSNDVTKKVISKAFPLLDLNAVPLPAIHLLDKSKYFQPGKVFQNALAINGNSATMITSRGCPFICSFCASPVLHHKKVRFRTVENVARELKILQEDYNVTEIRFQDDCFTLKPDRFLDLTNLLQKAGVTYRCSMRVDQVDEETLRNVWKGGGREIGFGIESAEDSVLQLLHKKTTVEQNRKALKMVKEFGFRVRAFMMTGLPGENENSAEKMIEFLEDTNPDVVTLTSFVPLPGSDVFVHPENYGVTILHKDWNQYNIALKWESNVPFVHTLDTATPEQMENNRELLKKYIFNKNKSNVKDFNKKYE